MAAVNCRQINSYLFRRTPDFDARVRRDRFPNEFIYSNVYKQEMWPLGTGTTHTRDKVHVSMPNDDGCWDAVTLGGSGTATGCDALCSPPRKVIGFGSTRYTYTKYQRDYTTPPFCYDQMRNVEEVIQQLEARLEGLREMPDQIVSDFIRLLAMRQAGTLYMAGSANIKVTITDSTFLANCTKIDLGGAGNLPTSQLTIPFLNRQMEPLLYNGYFKKQFMPQGTYIVTTDFQTQMNLSTQNPNLDRFYRVEDFNAGGKYYDYGLMADKVGNWMFKLDPQPLRFQHIGNGVLQRVWPFENVATTIGLTPEFSELYENAEYQAYHIINRDARTTFVGDISPVNPEMKFNMARSLLGKWSWKSPEYFTFVDPNTGLTCAYQNDKGNYGYFLGEYEIGMVTDYPLIERWIIAKREPACIVNKPNCSSSPAMGYQDLVPYNSLCNEGE